MAARGSMLQELCNYFLNDEYMTNIWSINLQDRVLEEEFYKCDLSDVYYLDTQFWITNANPCDGSHVFKLFGNYSANTAEEVRTTMISYVKTHKDYFEDVAKVPLLMNMRSLDGWIELMSHRGIRADEIALLALGIVYHRHILVITKNRPWCTVNVNCIKQEYDLYDHCSTHLLYMGHNMFGELKRKSNPLPALYEVAEFPLSQRATGIKSNLEAFSEIVEQYGERVDPNTSENRQFDYSPKYGGSDYEELNTFFDNNITSTQQATLSGNELPESADEPTVNTIPTLDSESELSESNHEHVPGSNTNDELSVEHVVPSSNEASSEPSDTPGSNTNNVEDVQNDIPGNYDPSCDRTTTPVNNGSSMMKSIPDSNVSDEPTENSMDQIAGDNMDGTPVNRDTGTPLNNKRRCIVKLFKLTEAEIGQYTSPTKDPSEVEDRESPPEFPTFASAGYELRERNPKRSDNTRKSDRGKRVVNYIESSSEDETRSRQRKKTGPPRPGLEPSLDRIRARQHGKTIHPSQVVLSQIGSSRDSDVDGNNTDSEEKIESPPAVNDRTTETPQPPTPVLKLRGAFKTTQHGVKHYKRKRCFKCSKCEYRCNTVKELNVHYRGNHSRSLCDICYKPFFNPMALKKHRLSHVQHKYPCRSCSKTFPYESQLKEHRIKHRRLATHKCNRGNCPKVFKRESDLDKHVMTHDEEHKCPECIYITNDIRLLRQHSQRHLDEGTLSCPNCGKKFKFSTQRKRHIDNKACEGDNSDSPIFE